MKITLSRALSLFSYLGLIAAVMLWVIWIGDVPREFKSVWLLLLGGPLLLPLFGVLGGRDKALIWGTLVALIYLVHGGMIAWSEPDKRWFGLIEFGLSLLYLVSASLFIRWRAESIESAGE